MSVKHSTTAIGTDSSDGLIGKSAWNADHVITSHGCKMLLNGGYAVTTVPSGNNVDGLWEVDYNTVVWDTNGFASVGYGTQNSMPLTGTISISAGGTTVTGVGTQFTTQFAVGRVLIGQASGQYPILGTVRSIASDTSLQIWQPAPWALTGGSVWRTTGMTIPIGLGGYYQASMSTTYEHGYYDSGASAWRIYGGWRQSQIYSIAVVSNDWDYQFIGRSAVAAITQDSTWSDSTTVSTSGTAYLNDLDIVFFDAQAAGYSYASPVIRGSFGFDQVTFATLHRL